MRDRGRDLDRDGEFSPERARGRGNGGAGRSKPPGPRRSSMPAPPKGGGASRGGGSKNNWWEHPAVRVGAQTAFAAGAQAAMKSRKDQGSWIGPKGAKVATAALGAALVDGFIGSSKHPRSNKVAKQGVEVAADGLAQNAFRH